MERTLLGKPRRYWIALAQEAALVFVGAFLVTWALPFLDFLSGAGSLGEVWAELLRWDTVEKGLLAGLVAVAAVVKGLIGGLVGNRATPSVLPARHDPATPYGGGGAPRRAR